VLFVDGKEYSTKRVVIPPFQREEVKFEVKGLEKGDHLIATNFNNRKTIYVR